MIGGTFRAAYDAVPKDADNSGVTILGGSGYDKLDKVVKIFPVEREDKEGAARIFVKARLHYTNEDAPITSFNRSIIVDFTREGGEWKIDNIRSLDQKGYVVGLRGGLKQAFELLDRSKGEARRGS